MYNNPFSDRSTGILGACLAVGVVLAGLAFWLLGSSIWTALLAVLLLICPAIIVWGLVATRRARPPTGDKS